MNCFKIILKWWVQYKIFLALESFVGKILWNLKSFWISFGSLKERCLFLCKCVSLTLICVFGITSLSLFIIPCYFNRRTCSYIKCCEWAVYNYYLHIPGTVNRKLLAKRVITKLEWKHENFVTHLEACGWTRYSVELSFSSVELTIKTKIIRFDSSHKDY